MPIARADRGDEHIRLWNVALSRAELNFFGPNVGRRCSTAFYFSRALSHVRALRINRYLG